MAPIYGRHRGRWFPCPRFLARTETGKIPVGPWQDFTGGRWQDQIDVRNSIQANLAPYAGDAAFLTGPTERTRALWSRLTAMFAEERARGVYDVDARTPASITSHAPGYIDREHELITGLQTDAPLRLGAPKYAALGLDYPCGQVAPPTAEQLGQARAAFTAAGLHAV